MLGNGDRYEGQFLYDLYHGNGVKIYANGDKEKGIWKNGILIKSTES